MADLVNSESQSISNGFSKFEEYLTALELPTENVIAEKTERERVLQILPSFIVSLDPEIKRDATYLSKFIAASAVGLFDSALNFVWDEIIKNLRKKVVAYGLDYFYIQAVNEKQRDLFKTEDDLVGIRDKTLLDTLKRLEIISKVVYDKLSFILTMRNNVGASHPTEYNIGSYELIGWLQTCIKDVLSVKPSEAAITAKAIIDNIKSMDSEISIEMLTSFEGNIVDLSSQMTSNMLMALFGNFVDVNTNNVTRNNILKISKIVWNHAQENAKYALGIKVDTFRGTLDQNKFNLAQIFFENVNGKRYFSLNARIIRLSNLIDNLLNAHYEMNNFYNEPPIANEIMQYINADTDIPNEIGDKIFTTLLVCRLGNEYGVSHAALQYYDSFFKILNKEQVIHIIYLFVTDEIVRLVSFKRPRTCASELFSELKSPILGDRINEILDYMISTKDLSNIYRDKRFLDLAKGVIII